MGRITERFPATVTNIDDEDSTPKTGRIKVTCIGLMGDEESEVPVWVEPALDWGWFYIPDIGEIVEVEVVAGTDHDESFGQSSIDQLDLRWRGKRFYTTGEGTVGDADQDPAVDARKVHAEFLTNYGKRRGFATPWGHILFFDDTDGDNRIVIMHSAEQLPHGEAFEDPTKYTRIEIEPDGSIKAQLVGKHKLHFQTEANKFELLMDIVNDVPKHTVVLDGNVPRLKASLANGDSHMLLDNAALVFEASVAAGAHKVTLDGTVPSFNIALDGGAGLNIDKADADTTNTIGDGAEAAMIASEMQTWLDNTYTPAIADMHDNHVHPLNQYIAPLIPAAAAPCLPGGPPSPDTPVAPASLEAYLSSITSTRVLFPAN